MHGGVDDRQSKLSHVIFSDSPNPNLTLPGFTIMNNEKPHKKRCHVYEYGFRIAR